MAHIAEAGAAPDDEDAGADSVRSTADEEPRWVFEGKTQRDDEKGISGYTVLIYDIGEESPEFRRAYLDFINKIDDTEHPDQWSWARAKINTAGISFSPKNEEDLKRRMNPVVAVCVLTIGDDELQTDVFPPPDRIAGFVVVNRVLIDGETVILYPMGLTKTLVGMGARFMSDLETEIKTGRINMGDFKNSPVDDWHPRPGDHVWAKYVVNNLFESLTNKFPKATLVTRIATTDWRKINWLVEKLAKDTFPNRVSLGYLDYQSYTIGRTANRAVSYINDAFKTSNKVYEVVDPEKNTLRQVDGVTKNSPEGWTYIQGAYKLLKSLASGDENTLILVDSHNKPIDGYIADHEKKRIRKWDDELDEPWVETADQTTLMKRREVEIPDAFVESRLIVNNTTKTMKVNGQFDTISYKDTPLQNIFDDRNLFDLMGMLFCVYPK